MARMTKKEREALAEAQRRRALWDSWDAALNEIHGSSGVLIFDDLPLDTPPEEPSPFDAQPQERETPPEQLRVREQLMNELGLAGADPDPAALDAVLNLGGMLADVVGTGLDALSPDPHALDPSTFGPAGGHSGLASAGQHLYDVALEIPGAARGILEWAGLEKASRSLGIHGLLEAVEGRAGETIEERERRAQAVAEARQEAGLPAIEDLRSRSPFNRAADVLYGLGDTIRGYTSPELKAAQEGLGQAMEDGLGSTLGYLASGPGMRALITGVIPESAAYAVPQLTVARGLRVLGAGPRLAQGAANTMTAYTVAQQNAREVADGIMSLSPEEALQLPDVAAEFERVGNIDVAKSIVANRARLTALAGGVITSPLYSIDAFSRMGAGVAQRATATIPVRALTAGGREALGEFVQEGSEAVVGDLGRLRAGQISRDEVGATALPRAALGAIAGAPTAAGVEVGQSISEFDARARRLEEAADRLEAIQREAEAQRAREAEEAAAAEAASAERQLDERLAAEQRQAEEDAAWEQRTRERALEENWEAQRSSIERRVDTARENVEALQERVNAGDTSRATLTSLTEALIEEREAASALEGHMRNDPSLRTPDTMTIEPAPAVAEQAETAEEREARIREEEQRAFALQEARDFDQQEQERGDAEARKRLAAAKGARTRQRRAHLASVREANMHLDPDARAEVIADAAIEWDRTNPEPTLESIAAEAPRAPVRRPAARPTRASRPGTARAPAAPEAVVEAPVEEEAPAAQPIGEERMAELRARYGRAQESVEERPGLEQTGSARTPAGRTAAEVLRELAKRVRRGTDKSALEAEALLTGGKLSIVDPEVMAAVAGATEFTEGYYDGERMYINAAQLPAGDPVGVLFYSVLAHEANHAATISQNPDAVSKVRMLLEDAPRRKLIEQLETADHPTAIAAREAVAARNIDKATDPARYEDELVAYAINHAIESGGRSWAPIRGLVSAARRKLKDYTGSDNLNLNDLGYYARATVNALAESEAGINAPGVAGREQIAMHGTPVTFAPEEDAPLGRMRSDRAFTGGGAQVYGAGHYLTQQWDTAENRYRLRLAGKVDEQHSREGALEWAMTTAGLGLDNPSDLTAEDVVDNLIRIRDHYNSELSRVQAARESSRDNASELAYLDSRVTELERTLEATESALELAENSDLRQMQELVEAYREDTPGEVYYADIPEDSEMMHWQEPVSTRSQEMQDALLSIDPDANLEQPFASWYIQRSQSKGLGRTAGDRAVSDELAAAGIKGHIFSGRTDGPRNFVVYSDDDVSIGGRDRREFGETRREMEAFGEEIQSRPDSSRSLREQFEAEARQRAQEERAARPRTELALEPFEGRAQEAVADAVEEAKVRPYVAKTPSRLLTAAKDAFTVHGSIGENAGRMMQEANYARDAIYQTAIYRYHRVGPAMNAAADKATAGEEGSVQERRERFNDMILERLENIAQLPTESAKDKALARLVQQYPDLAPLAEAIQDINKMTDTIISARLAYEDTRPLTNEEQQLYYYMHKNKYGYLTRIYAAFQGENGKKYVEAVMNAGAQGMKALAEGKEVPPKLRRLYQVYDDALRFIMENDVAVSDPEMLAAMSLKDVSALYDRWMPDGMRAADLAQELRNGNGGQLDTDSFKAIMEERIAEHVAMLKDPDYVTDNGTTGSEILHNHANAVMRALLENQPLSGPAARYAKARGIDTTILEHRANLPEAIANLYGQVRDIPSLINATLTRQGELASRLNFFNRMAAEGYGDMVVSAADRHLRGNENFTVPLSGPSFGRLNGMYTTPEMAKRLADYGNMFTDLVDTIAIVGVNPTMARHWLAHRLGEAWTTGAGMQKAAKIVTRPDYHLLNLVGSFSSPVLAGGVKPAHLLTGMKVALEHVALQIDPKGRAIGPELSAAHQLALQTGAFDSAVVQELRRAPRKLVNRLLEEMTTVDTVGGAMNLLKKAGRWSNDRGWQTLVETYTMMDTWVKLPVLLERMDYLESYYKANGDNITRDELVQQAARYMRDATISMDNVPGLAKFAERTGLSFYLPYFASVFRVLHKSNVHFVDSVRMAVNARTPEAKWIAGKDAARKAAGIGIVWATAIEGLKYITELGMDDEDKEQMERDRELMFDEAKYGDLRYLGVNDQGHRQYLLTSRTDQFGPAFDIARGMRRADSMDEALKMIPKGMWDLFVANRLIGALIDHTARGDKNTQLERTLPAATTWFKEQADRVPKGRAAMEYFFTAADTVTPAGIMNYFDPRNKTPIETQDNAAAIISSIAAVTGHTLVTVNPEAALRGKSFELRDHRRDANSRIRESIQNLGPMAGFRAFLAEAEKERSLTEELGKMYYSRIDSGMSRQEVEDMLEGLDSVTIRNLRNRAYTSERNRWAKEWSGLLSMNSINNPPDFLDLPPEERQAAQEEWRRQAIEVNKLINAMNIKEKR